MKKPPKEILEELTCQPYQIFEGLDYQRMMSMKYPAIRIDVNNEQLQQLNLQNKKKDGLPKDDEEQQISENARTNGTDDPNINSEDESEQNGQENEQDKSNLVYVCGLIIDIEMISKQQILKLRKLMPKKDYR